jgi:hypothetical protein
MAEIAINKEIDRRTHIWTFFVAESPDGNRRALPCAARRRAARPTAPAARCLRAA